jgi:hypothetical protein
MTADDGRGSLRGHLPAADPPPDLAGRVRAALEARGLVRLPNDTVADRAAGGGQASRRGITWVVGAGLVAAGFVIGLVASGTFGRAGGRPASARPGQYVVLLYGDPADDTGAVHVAREREYGRWASTLSDGARWVGGHELADVVEGLGPAGSTPVAYDDRLAGYFVIEAPSRERAADVARSCPHLKYGGRVVVMAVAS